MCDQNGRHVELCREVVEQIEKADPDRDVDHRDRLVGDDHAWIDGQRARDRHALTLTPGELVGIFEQEVCRWREADALEQRDHRRAGRSPVSLLVLGQGWGERLRDRARRIQRRVWVLMDELDRAAKASEILALLLPDVPRASGPSSSFRSRSRRRGRSFRSRRATARRRRPP